MAIDIFYGVLLALALFYGFRRGLVRAVFSVLALFAGIIGALMFSDLLIGYLSSLLDIQSKYLPVIAFVLAFILILLIVNLAAAGIERFLRFIQLNFLNKLAGATLFGLLATVFVSTCLWLADMGDVLTEELTQSSYSYPLVFPVAPVLYDGLSIFFPFINEFRASLTEYFNQVS